MARMPGATWKPLASNWSSQPRMSRFDIICIHTMVGSLAGTDSYFRDGNGSGFSGTESHFGTGYDGEIRQWQDTAYQADANLNGNGHIISIENADFGTGFPVWNTNDGSAVPAFTDAQIEAIAKIVAWACEAHDIPCELIPDSKPGRRGVGYHRQGVDPYRVSGGELWSSAVGKVCPGNRRIAQIPQIIARAKEILRGDDVPLTSAEKNEIAELTVAKLLAADVSEAYAGTQSLKNVLSQVWTNSRDSSDADAILAAVKKLPADVRAALADAIVQVDVNVAGQQPPAA